MANHLSIKNLIENNNFLNAIDEILVFVKNDDKVKSHLILLKSQIIRLIENKNLGLIDNKNYDLEINRITIALLNIVERNVKNKPLLKNGFRYTLNWKLLTFFSLILLFTLFLVYTKYIESQKYQAILNTENIVICNNFLEKYPNSKYTPLVQKRIHELNTKVKKYIQSAQAMIIADEPEKVKEFLEKASSIDPNNISIIELQKQFVK